MKRKIHAFMQIFEYVVALSIFAVVIMYAFNRPAQVSEYATHSNEDRNETIKSIIVWDTDYSERLENLVVYNLNLLPESILESWLETDCSVVVCPNLKGYLDADIASELTGNSHSTAYNVISTSGDEVVGSDIYILGSSQIINSSLLHEIGHYVYYEYFGATTDYVLPNHETDCARFVETERDGHAYYLETEEYFAEIFAYTVLQGVNEEYPDTQVMKKIIDDF